MNISTPLKTIIMLGILLVLFPGTLLAQTENAIDFSLESTLLEVETITTETEISEIQDLQIAALPGDKIRISMTINGAKVEPTSFTVDEPARIALDFPNTRNKLGWRNRKIGVGMVKSITAIEAGDRTRIVINLIKQVVYQSRFDDDKFVLTLGSDKTAQGGSGGSPTRNIDHIDFRRGDLGEGRVILTFSAADVIADVREEGGRILVDVFNVTLPEKLQQRLDVVDFATPITSIDTVQEGDNVRITILPSLSTPYEHVAYQSDNTFTIDVKAASVQASAKTEQKEFTGEKLSLNFQDIEVRSVLQLLADFTGLNVVVSDAVQGSITLRLKNIPWDQALDIILKTKSLAMRQNGNVILVAPSTEISTREKQELEARKQISELAPMRSELIQVNYAKANDLSTLIKSGKNSLLSKRGSVTIDERTNTLLVRDTPEQLAELRKLVSKLDVPIRQVLIESRIVIAKDDFSRDLGATLKSQSIRNLNGTQVGGGAGLTDGFDPSTSNLTTAFGGYNVDMPAIGQVGRFSLAILSGSSDLLALELSALQVENRGEIVSNPRVITSNQQKAVIEQGTEIPYQQSTSSGATTVAFKKAVLSLNVTPQITPDDRIILDLKVSKDSVSGTLTGADNVPAIDTNAVHTQVLVDNGETVVLGGIYEQVKRKQVSKIPLLGDIPFIGHLFRTTSEEDDKNELLIFVTPKILKESLQLK